VFAYRLDKHTGRKHFIPEATMFRLLLTLGIGLLLATAAFADLKPPMGLKNVPIDHKFTTEKEYPDYLFFTISGGKGPRAKLTEVKLDPKTPANFPGAGRTGIGRLGTLVAVPKESMKKYNSEKEFHDAIKDQKVEGMLATTARLDSQTTIKDTDKRTVIVREHSIEKIDAKAGIVIKTKPDEALPAKDAPKKEPQEEEEETAGVTAYTPQGGVWIAGLAAALALTLGGFWLVGRGRRKA
jgi:hypothetical protein